MRCPAGRPVRFTRAVKSVSSSAEGPTTRRVFAKEGVVEYSTISRAGRSLRLQTIAWPAVTSPVATPHGTPGRSPSRVMMAGARSWRAAAIAAAASVRKLRRSIFLSGALSKNKCNHENTKAHEKHEKERSVLAGMQTAERCGSPDPSGAESSPACD